MEWKRDRGLQARMVLTLALVAVVQAAILLGVAWFAGDGLPRLADAAFPEYQYTGSALDLSLWMVGACALGVTLVQSLLGYHAALWSISAVPAGEGWYAGPQAVLNRLSHQADLPVPDLWVFETELPTAFTIGTTRSNMRVVVSTVFWVASFLVYGLLSRYREHAADRGAARITGDPAALANALETIDRRTSSVPDRDLRQYVGGVEALAVAPLDAGTAGESDLPIGRDRLPDTHPPTGERIEHLREIQRSLSDGDGQD